MKYNLKRAMLNMADEPMGEATASDFIQRVLGEATGPGGAPLTLDEQIHCDRLRRRIRRADDGEIDLQAEDVVRIKELSARAYMPFITGQIVDLLEGCDDDDGPVAAKSGTGLPPGTPPGN